MHFLSGLGHFLANELKYFELCQKWDKMNTKKTQKTGSQNWPNFLWMIQNMKFSCYFIRNTRKRSNAVRQRPTTFIDQLDTSYGSTGYTNIISPTFTPPVPQFASAFGSPMTSMPFPTLTPPMIPYTNAQSTTSFSLKWVINTTVSMCYGCSQPIQNPPTNSLEALCVVYRDYRCYRDSAGSLKWSNKPENVHFHLHTSCILRKYASFLPNTLYIPPSFEPFLDEQQRAVLTNIFGVVM